jgi:hypothetical protein
LAGLIQQIAEQATVAAGVTLCMADGEYEKSPGRPKDFCIESEDFRNQIQRRLVRESWRRILSIFLTVQKIMNIYGWRAVEQGSKLTATAG